MDPTDSCEETGQPVRYSTGEAQIVANDLSSSGFGTTWGHTRRYRSGLGYDADVGQGYNWLIDQWPSLIIQSTSVVALRSDGGALWFDDIGGGQFQSRYGVKARLVHEDDVYNLITSDGTVEAYGDDSQAELSGKLLQLTGPNREELQFAYSESGQLRQVLRTATIDGVSVSERFQYDYLSSGENSGNLSSVVLARRAGSAGAWSPALRVAYGYLCKRQPLAARFVTDFPNGADCACYALAA